MSSDRFAFLTFSLNDSTLGELQKLVGQNRLLDGIILYSSSPAESPTFAQLNDCIKWGARCLNNSGRLLILCADDTWLIKRDDFGERHFLNLLDSPYHLFTLDPKLAEIACATIPHLDRRRTEGGGGLLAHILHSSVCVLTDSGKSKQFQLLQRSTQEPVELILSMIDNFNSVGALLKITAKRFALPESEVIRMIQEIEHLGYIYPIFTRLEFLARCYHHKRSFRLGSYMVAAKLLTESQLQDLLIKQNEMFESGKRPLLGQLAVAEKIISSRQLEVILFDQFVYSRKHPADLSTKNAQNSVANSMLGSLDTMSPGGLIQSLVSDSKTGMLTVEYAEKTACFVFKSGKITAAKLGGLRARDAVTQFLANWHKGIFVFRNDIKDDALDVSYSINVPVEKMMLDAALSEDQNNQILALFKDGATSILENASNFDSKQHDLLAENVFFIDETPLSAEQKIECISILKSIDGFCSINELIAQYGSWTTNKLLKYLHILLKYQLIQVQSGNIVWSIAKLQQITDEVSVKIGREENLEMLRASVEDSDDKNEQIFFVDEFGRIGFHSTYIKQNGLSLDVLNKQFAALFNTYINYCSAELDKSSIDEILSIVDLTSSAIVSPMV